MIQMGDHGIVFSNMQPYFIFLPRPGSQNFIPALPYSIIYGMRISIIRGQFNLLRIIKSPILIRHTARIMGCHKRFIEKKGILNISACTSIKKIDCCICKKFRRMFTRGNMIADIHNLFIIKHRIINFPGAGCILTCWIKTMRRDIPMVLHTAEKDLPAGRKCSGIGFCSIMPFSGSKCGVSGFAEGFSHGDMLGRNTLTFPLNMEQGSACPQHCPAWHTNRSAGTAGNMSMGKSSAFLY